ncbi:peptide-methionine (R)-S-oxide reductase MsrB [Marinicella rhabdoformis]|uniref:peptide-methionine (R)-S-oxide reductase MsrB n=1 Tax=Marinicella rhabdoformis TaxID=2580566 RepID=UPI001C5555ED|nr:peptide-methionine (R)-S-oxide reductase MsrB [Marinicella rhabdoformis]
MTMKQETKDKLKQKLDADSYHVIAEKGTERPHTGKYNLHFEKGVYHCKSCGEALFADGSKFDAGCGWPSFDQEIEAGKIKEVFDDSHGMRRTEIVCAKCGGHLGHVFNDGPTETGLRYCVNSLSLNFEAED